MLFRFVRAWANPLRVPPQLGGLFQSPLRRAALIGALVLPKLQSAAWHPSGLVCAMATHPINDYYIITSRRGEHPDRWSWEMRRKSKPLGIKMTGDGFQSEMAAQFAGKRALADFLSDLSKEEKDPRK